MTDPSREPLQPAESPERGWERRGGEIGLVLGGVAGGILAPMLIEARRFEEILPAVIGGAVTFGLLGAIALAIVGSVLSRSSKQPQVPARRRRSWQLILGALGALAGGSIGLFPPTLPERVVVGVFFALIGGIGCLAIGGMIDSLLGGRSEASTPE